MSDDLRALLGDRYSRGRLFGIVIDPDSEPGPKHTDTEETR